MADVRNAVRQILPRPAIYAATSNPYTLSAKCLTVNHFAPLSNFRHCCSISGTTNPLPVNHFTFPHVGYWTLSRRAMRQVLDAQRLTKLARDLLSAGQRRRQPAIAGQARRRDIPNVPIPAPCAGNRTDRKENGLTSQPLRGWHGSCYGVT
jgi:hypothetical protein